MSDDMKKVKVKLNGCDDTTEISISLTDAELELMKAISQLTIAASDYACKPTLTLAWDKD